ncbi:MAG: ABC transporter ATP-binding protein [Bacteroidetes bacterium]|nr:MAG: ABC transporter ATP-binding protein [Bacteroidota bacterium]
MLEEKEKSGRVFDGKVLRQVYLFVIPYRTKFYTLIGLTLLAGILAPIRPYLIRYTTDNHILTGDFNGLLWVTILLIGLLFSVAFIEYLNSYLSGWLGQTIIRDVRLKLYNHLLKHKLSFYDKTPIGRLITRNISDIETIADIFTEGLADIAGSILQLTFIMAIMFYMNWKLTLISLSVIPVLLICTYIFKEKVKASFSDVRTAVANLNTFVQEHITGMNIVQIFTAENTEYHKFTKINEQHKSANLRSVLYYSVYFPVAEVLSAIGIGVLVWYAGGGILANEITFGTLLAFIMYIQMFFRPIREIADKFNTLQMGIVGSSRVLKLLENEDFIPQEGNILKEKIEGNIKFENVYFAYNDNDYVLKNISFEVKKGETIAFVGSTGAGKSSIINLLNRFYDINKGKITIDGIDIQEFSLQSLRESIGTVMQDVFLFSDSIAHNIHLGKEKITDEQILEAAKAIGAEEFIKKLPNGLHYEVMERGATLSVGQRQLVSFLRAMIHEPKIVILDEATSSIDSETEALIQVAMEKLLKGRTSIIVAHRLSTIRHANKIFVIDKGEIAESGTHAELLALNGKYANLVNMQLETHKIR